MRRVEIGQRSETAHRANLSAILRELHLHGPRSRSELVRITGLTRSAIRGLIGEFAVAGLVSEDRAAPLGTPGRPSALVHLNPDRALVLALEIAVDSLAVALVGLGGEVRALARVDRERGHTTLEQVIDDLVELAAIVDSRPSARAALVGVGVSIVGVVRRSDGLVSMAPNLGWRDAPLVERLATALGLPVPIAVANDADLGALAELRRGAARGADDVLFIAGEVGVGGGLIVGGRPLTGEAGYAGEIGHIPLNPNGTRCGCGSIGCWETEIGEGALLTRAGYPPDGGRVAVEAVLRAAEAGSPVARGALDAVGHWLGVGLAGLVNVFNPGLVVLGGRFSRLYPFVAPTIEAELDRLALPAPRRLVRVVPATLGVNASLLGAAELAFEPLLDDPAAWLHRQQVLPALATA